MLAQLPLTGRVRKKGANWEKNSLACKARHSYQSEISLDIPAMVIIYKRDMLYFFPKKGQYKTR